MDNTFSLLRGQVVRSKKGRDEGKVFVITEIIDENFLYLVDGKLRKLDRPKKKKVKHLYIYNSFVDLDIKDLNDSYIRKKLLPYS
ncbi:MULTISPECIES: KOW domain-containing RNA-binding protein [Peptoniphilus]|jgi:putative 50S ribosomal protein L14e|uniref:KOW domain-containing RNA-binding protein n=1 Tax=Peptoniphilus TaxID=162289 RepID=UPI0002885DF6|nr:MULTISPECIES: KOW domain-containing RNA-binding protein [Peptoniphilus]MBS6610248.1 KOW domain-containing protein [Peptoniphilus harei]MDU1043725.1 KOW domain-containing RNA-binding protein [Peptoniphilus rhinitidis]MDU1954448.1 KOW domain-containing RNA-binding protein [Peptoniphilus lacydonensis]MDU2115511.1 KOW domain-containing RNA-binding protein [Peptoniphilus lacydonensis]MDU3751517.1 KOW domain-containing RNA-binding protein [Peptoniphilus rhinitidis]